jgi:hypothetical protein
LNRKLCLYELAVGDLRHAVFARAKFDVPTWLLSI